MVRESRRHSDRVPSTRFTQVTDVIVHWTEAVAVGALAVLAAGAVVFLLLAGFEVARDAKIESLQATFNAILLVFIMVELYSLGAHFLRGENVVDKVFELGLVALVRQLIVAEFLHTSVTQLLAIAALVLSLSGGWYLARIGAKRGVGPGDEEGRLSEEGRPEESSY